MFIRKKPLYDGKVAVQICEGFRENGKVRQRVLRHVGSADRNDRENLDRLMQVATFLKGDIEKEIAEKEEKNAPSLPLFLPAANPSEEPDPQDATSSEQGDKEHHWVDLSELKEESRLIEGIHAIFGSTLDRFNLQSIFGGRHYRPYEKSSWPALRGLQANYEPVRTC
jgi:hypothetical protein